MLASIIGTAILHALGKAIDGLKVYFSHDSQESCSVYSSIQFINYRIKYLSCRLNLALRESQLSPCYIAITVIHAGERPLKADLAFGTL